MALSTQTTKVRYVGDGVATYFPIPFPVYNSAHVRVFTSDADGISTELSTGFDVFEEDTRTYAISFYEPLPAGQAITIARLLPLTQDLDLENGGNFSAEEIETTFDLVVMLIQQLQEELDRAVKTGIAAEESGLSVEEIYAQVEEIVRRAEDALLAIKKLVEPVILAKGTTNLRGTWTTQDALPAGSLLRLAVGYFPNRNMLALSMDGLECYPVSVHEANGLHQYEEVGGEDEISHDVRLLFDAPAGAVWSAWSIASNVSELQEDLLAETEAARDRTEAARDRAEVAAEVATEQAERAERYAEQAQAGNLPTASPEVKGLVNSGGNDGELFGTVENQYKMIPRVELLASAMLAGLVPAFSGNNLKLIVNEHGQMEWVKDKDNRYELCEFYYFRHPTLKPGFMPAHGGLLENTETLYPEAWAYLQTEEGQKLCKTEAEWQAMTRAVWHTNADGSKVSWNGIGGAPFFAPNWETGALRLPDLRGMYAEAAGFDSLGVGGTHGDGMRQMKGTFSIVNTTGNVTGVFFKEGPGVNSGATGGGTNIMKFDNARICPVTSKNQPRAYGVLACVYLGIPK